MKYPRTYHLPYSPGATKDDKKLQDGWFMNYKDKEIVITEKLDGENIHMTKKDCYARSDGAPTRSDWSLNIWNHCDGIYWDIKKTIGDNEIYFGENLYGEHSIKYSKLPTYFFLFAACDDNNFYSWDDVLLISEIAKVQHVPVLWEGKVSSEKELEDLVNKFVKEPSLFGDTREGVVIRIKDSFPIEDFSKCVCKWVRPNHVQTDEHWTKNWKKADIIDHFEELPDILFYKGKEYKWNIYQVEDKNDTLYGWWIGRYGTLDEMPPEVKGKNGDGYFLCSANPTYEETINDMLERVNNLILRQNYFII